ncbi:MAG: guanylate kinase [Thermodesulfobacteriota bacterium]
MSGGSLFVVSAPSGAGKSTILGRVIAGTPNLTFSVSHTTRSPRPGEEDGVHYHFVRREAFVAMQAAGAFLEWAEVHGNLYGTSRLAVESQLGQGLDVVLDIDTQGAAQIRRSRDLPALFIFILPPSWAELERRLRGRGTDPPEVVARRLANARQELASLPLYDFAVENDSLEEAVETMRAIIVASRSRRRCRPDGRPLPVLAMPENP